MVIQKKPDLTYADVTPKALYMGRRNFLLGLLATTAVVAGWKKLPRWFAGPSKGSVPVPLNGLVNSKYTTTGEKVTPENYVTTYNNYYEFGTDKGDPAKNAKNFVTSPWTVSVEGEVAKPRKFTMDEILKLAPLEERIYRHRCVEAWSIVVPWIGYSFSTIAKLVEPTPNAKLRRFRDLLRSEADASWRRQPESSCPTSKVCASTKPCTRSRFSAVGMYGETLPNQDGAPVRMVMPWKYGFKSIKSIVKIRFVKRPAAHHLEYLRAQRIRLLLEREPQRRPPALEPGQRAPPGGEFFAADPTLMFNGYGDQVAELYAGMDLRKNF